MPAIVATSIAGNLVRTITETTLNGTDSLTFNTGKNPILTFRNPTGGALTPVIVGSTATTVPVAGIGNVSVASGYSCGSVAAGVMVSVPLNTIKEFLKGTISITGGTGLVAHLLEY